MIAELAKTTGRFGLPALAEIVGCYLPWLVLKQGKPAGRTDRDYRAVVSTPAFPSGHVGPALPAYGSRQGT